MKPPAAYHELVRIHQSIALLSSTKSLLEWDEETTMPEGGALHRSRQVAELAGRIHQELVDPKVAELLAIVAESDLVRDATGAPAVNVRHWKRQVDRTARLDRALVEETAAAVSLSQRVWVGARQADDYATFLPHLTKVIDLKRREARAIASSEEREPWNALLFDYEPGMTAARLEQLFAPLGVRLRTLLARIEGASRKPRVEVLHRAVPAADQARFARDVVGKLGFDFSRGRIDTSAHPFSTHLGPGDVRLTTRFYENDLTEGLFGALHETGHGLYDQGLPEEAFGTPRGDAASYGVHESQSRLWENFVGRSTGFWQFFYPVLRRAWPGVFDDVGLDDFVFAINAVGRGVNRVRADEVTYNLHIFVRFGLERALFAGDLAAVDLPRAWAEAYEREVGVRPVGDPDGCLQDGHWAAGLFGYFPTYAIGNLMAAQLHRAASRELGDLDQHFARGDFAPLLEWLRTKVHTLGRTFDPESLVEHVSGEPLGTATLADALDAKYGAHYRL